MKVSYSTMKNGVLSVGTGALLLAGNAYAAVPVEVTTAMSDAKTDATAIAALSLIIVIALAAFGYMKRAK